MSARTDGRALGLALADVEQENALLLGIIDAASTGPAIEPLAAAVAELITQATATDVCFVHVLDAERSLTLVGATPPFDEQVGRIQLPVGTGVTELARSPFNTAPPGTAATSASEELAWPGGWPSRASRR